MRALLCVLLLSTLAVTQADNAIRKESKDSDTRERRNELTDFRKG